MSKYKPLSDRLAQHDGEEWRASFAELEEVLGFPLPKSAREQNAWWLGAEKPHHTAWTQGGWGVGEVDRVSGAVLFRRTSTGALVQAAKTADAAPGADSETASEPTGAQPTEAAPEPAADSGDSVIGKARKAAAPTVTSGAAALLAGAAAMVARVLARRKGEPWR